MGNESRGFHAMPLPKAVDGKTGNLKRVHLLPAGEFMGRDGRGPYRADASAILQAYANWGMPLAIDYDHQGVNTAKNGAPAPAAGWIKRLVNQNDGLWGDVEWTPRAQAMIAAGEYLYLSPVFDHTKSGTAIRLLGAGLTNSPNLHLTAIASRLPGVQSGNPLVRDAMARHSDGSRIVKFDPYSPLIADAMSRKG